MIYISHLDMMRLFRGAFKRAGMKLEYTQGFNPHPKLSFAQPLPLGYSSSCEMLEFELKEYIDPKEVLNKINSAIPKGISVSACNLLDEGKKSLASLLIASSYEIYIPVKHEMRSDIGELCEIFLDQQNIMVEKKRQKSGPIEEIDIRNLIHELSGELVDDKIIMHTKLDSGSLSNLSPELFLHAFLQFSAIKAGREEIEVKRDALFFNSCQELLAI